MKTLGQMAEDYLDDLRRYAELHPVPLPNNPAMLQDLASIGVPGARLKLNEINARIFCAPAEKLHCNIEPQPAR